MSLSPQIIQAYCEMFTNYFRKTVGGANDRPLLQQLAAQVSDSLDCCGSDTLLAWHGNMCAPLPPAVKYAKALRRIVGDKACLYMAVAYRDVDAICIAFPELVQYRDEYNTLTAAERVQLWDGVTEMTNFMARKANYDIGDIPSSADIQKNIQEHRRAKQCTGLVTCFSESVADMFTLVDMEIPSKYLPPAVSSAFRDWTDQLQVVVNGNTWTQACLQGDVDAVLAAEWACHSDIKEALRANPAKGIKVLVQMNSCVEHATDTRGDMGNQSSSTSVMGKIEQQAQKLAHDLSSGRISDISNVNLGKIGQDVLSQCNQQEMQDFMSSMGNILPALNTMSKNFRK